jgi:predicted alpha-1,2-mannosidase
MKFTGNFLLLSFILFFSCSLQQSKRYSDLVNPFIGTSGHGHTYPGATLPFGMVQLSPDTDNQGWDWCSGYHYSDQSIMGFSHTHISGAGGADYGDILLMPFTGKLQTEPGPKDNPDAGFRSRFSHQNETANAGYYRVFLDDYRINAELTCTRRAGIHQYTFPASDSSWIAIDLQHGISDRVRQATLHIISKTEIAGFRRSQGWNDDQQIYFYARVSRPFDRIKTFQDGHIGVDGDSLSRLDVKAFLGFKTGKNEVILAKIGISAVSIDGARRNLDEEMPDWNFTQTRENAQANWDKALRQIRVEGATQKDLQIFYTALYHALITPNLFMDTDGRYRGMDGKIHQADGFKNYTLFSLWDTFRATHPLFTLLRPQDNNDFIRSMLAKYEQSGYLPIWELAGYETGTMIGYHAVPVIADAYMKGLRDFDAGKALLAMKHSAESDVRGLKFYKQTGYVASDKEHESVSKTLEYAYDDWCIAQMAREMGQMNDYQQYMQRALSYQNLFDGANGFMRGRKLNSDWIEPFNPFEVTRDFTEANAWQYAMFVPHDVYALINLHGGERKFNRMLDRLFTEESRLEGKAQADISGMIGQYAHGNEPSHHLAYLYNYSGQPWKTQERVRQILSTQYADTPAGLCGNDDCGQLSAWYLFSALGFYPVCPGSNEYVIGSPLFEKVTIDIPALANDPAGSKTFTISARGASTQNKYIAGASLNGQTYHRNYITHRDLINGGELVLQMASTPSRTWGVQEENRPSLRKMNHEVTIPYLKSNISNFIEKATVTLGCNTDSAEIHYTLDGSEPRQTSLRFEQPFEIDHSLTLKARAFKKNLNSSRILTVNATKVQLLPAVKPASIQPGLYYEYLEGPFLSVFDFAKLQPKKKGVINNFLLTPAETEDHFALKFSGLVQVPKDGIYTFSTLSDDGSVLYIDQKEIVNNDGSHAALLTSGEAALKQGFHRLLLLYFEDYEGNELQVLIEGPGLEKQAIPATMLFH